jgi:hypothetical protein
VFDWKQIYLLLCNVNQQNAHLFVGLHYIILSLCTVQKTQKYLLLSFNSISQRNILYIKNNLSINWLYTIVIPTNAKKYIKDSYKQTDLHVSANHVNILREAKHIGRIHKKLNDGSIRTNPHIHDDNNKHHSLKYMNIYVVDRLVSLERMVYTEISSSVLPSWNNKNSFIHSFIH